MRLDVSAILLMDGYKVGHKEQYPDDTTLVYSNMTARSSRTGVKEIVAFGMQYFIQEYLVDEFNVNFFQRDRDEVMAAYERRIGSYLGPRDNSHIRSLHELGYLPLHIKAVPEGTLVPLRVPLLTLYNTHPDFYWVTNAIETLMSNILWGAITSATTARRYRQVFDQYADMTGADKEFVPFQGHDFSFRGLTGIENAMLSGAAHLLSFQGTDTIPAIDFLEQYYGANSDKELIGGSIPATEHSVMCVGEKANEIDTFRRLITEVYPAGPVAIVSDTWDLWTVLTQYLPLLKDEIMARDGKVVIRPDSGDPELIICGNPAAIGVPEHHGVMRMLWELFGGEVNAKGYKVLDPHIGLIYGEAINPEKQVSILENMARQGFASSNIVFGIGSYTYNYVTRDTYGMAIKSTYAETRSAGGIPIFKDPATDDGLKKSAFGLLRVARDGEGRLMAEENVTWDEEATGELKTIFLDGEPRNFQTLAEIRARLAAAR